MEDASAQARAIIRSLWEEKVRNGCVYRGMDAADLSFPMDPARSPFHAQEGLLLRFFDLMDRLTAAGLDFPVIESHFGNECRHELKNILDWTRRDLHRPGIDFTSRCQSAREYSDCWQGSQLKQNIRTILGNLAERELPSPLSRDEQAAIDETARWIGTPRPRHPVVLHLRREADVFMPSEALLPLSPFERFKRNVLERLPASEIVGKDPILRLLPEDGSEFYCTAIAAIQESDILRIEDV